MSSFVGSRSPEDQGPKCAGMQELAEEKEQFPIIYKQIPLLEDSVRVWYTRRGSQKSNSQFVVGVAHGHYGKY